MFGYAWALYVGIWSFFLKAYIDATANNRDGLNYILIAGALSSIVFGLWRWHTRYVDNAIANLYPTLVHCEQIMKVPPEYGTMSYLGHFIGTEFKIDLSKETEETILRGVEHLVVTRRAGHRSHGWLDSLALSIILAQLVLIAVLSIGRLLTWQVIVSFLAMASGAVFACVGRMLFQRNPSSKEILNAFSKRSQQQP
jgi:hypothetical protein